MKSQGIPKVISVKGRQIKVGGTMIKIDSQSVPLHLGESPEAVLEKLRDAAKGKIFPPIVLNA